MVDIRHRQVVQQSATESPRPPICANCGAKVDRTDVICPNCGETLVGG
jgi:predicted amidophosphoribosyltransferase